MTDAIFENPRLATIYDSLHGHRRDLDVYVGLLESLGVRRVLDIGCGTGTFVIMLADRGYDVIGVDPAGASLDVARRKPSADRVQWHRGDATTVPATGRDAVIMTANVAQAIADPMDWDLTLAGAHRALRAGGMLVFETRDPADRAWERWNRRDSHAVTDVPLVGAVESWVDVTSMDWPLVTFRWTYVFAADGARLVSDSTLRFRERDEVEAALTGHGFDVEDVRGAPDRPGRELVFIARRRSPT